MQRWVRNLRLRSWLRHMSTPTAKLSLAYVGILMAISIIFSAVLYHFAVNQLVHGLGRQYEAFRMPPGNGSGGAPMPQPFDASHIPASVQHYINEGKHSLIFSLIYFNAVILILGTALSYWLARRTVRPIEVALEAQSRFTADASHELRTPLAVMRTEIEIARSDPHLTKDEAIALLDSNLEEAIKLHDLSEGLLRLARSENGSIKLGPTRLGQTVDDAIARITSMAALYGIEIRNDSSADVVLADQQSLTELLVILLENAIKYSDAGSAVTIMSERRGHMVTISVRDEGRGIAPEALPHIFDRFYRADSSRTSLDVGGHGLGLSIARQIADLHRTTISVDTKVGIGTTFTVALRGIS